MGRNCFSCYRNRNVLFQWQLAKIHSDLCESSSPRLEENNEDWKQEDCRDGEALRRTKMQQLKRKGKKRICQCQTSIRQNILKYYGALF